MSEREGGEEGSEKSEKGCEGEMISMRPPSKGRVFFAVSVVPCLPVTQLADRADRAG